MNWAQAVSMYKIETAKNKTEKVARFSLPDWKVDFYLVTN
jgi:hypothetical protein